MATYDPVPLPRSSEPAAVIDGIDAWIGSAPMRELVTGFGGEPPDLGPAGGLDYLERFSAEHWDFRAGRERFETDAARLDAGTEALVAEAAAALGLRGRIAPRRDRYDHMLILGGLVSSCLFRTRFAAELVAGGVRAGDISGVGGYRRFNDRDLELARLAGFTGGHYEIDAMEEGLKRGFGLDREPAIADGGDPGTDPGAAWKIAEYPLGDVRVFAVAAPSSRPGRRPDTADTCRFWADHAVSLRPGDSVLVVTSSLFVPFQHCDALTHIGLPYDCVIDTAGVDTTTLPEPQYRKDYTASTYLQEIRSAIRSMRRLHDTAIAAAPAHDASRPTGILDT